MPWLAIEQIRSVCEATLLPFAVLFPGIRDKGQVYHLDISDQPGP